jgi:CRISPR/Cas system-associated exonuclease Cas4 (RecB family)
MDTAAALASIRSRPHLSASAVQSWLRCGRQFEFKLRKIPPAFTPSSLAFGSSVHAATGAYFDSLARGEGIPPLGLTTAKFTDTWHRYLDGPIPLLLGSGESEGGLLDLGVKMVEVFHRDVPRFHRLLGAEVPFSVELVHHETGEVLPSEFSGFWDALAQSEDRYHQIIEVKTGKRRWSEDKLAWDIQLTAYVYAATLQEMVSPTVTVLLLLKHKQPSLVTYTPARGDRDFKDLIDLVFHVDAAISAGSFPPIRDWHCNGCQWAGPCLAG